MDCLIFDSEIDYVSYIMSSGNFDTDAVVLTTSEMRKQFKLVKLDVGEQYEKDMRSIIEAIL